MTYAIDGKQYVAIVNGSNVVSFALFEPLVGDQRLPR